MDHRKAVKRAFLLYKQYKTDTREYRELADYFGVSTAELNVRNWHINSSRKMDSANDFKLANDPPRVRPQSFDNGEKTRQRVLVDGMNCLPGQLDLFD